MGTTHPDGPRSPEDVVREVADALNDQRWSEVSSLIDREGLGRWRARIDALIRHYAVQPSSDRIAVEWGVSDLSELQQLADDDLFARWLAAESYESRRRIAVDVDLPSGPKVRRVVLGGVREGNAIAHVVYRQVWEPPTNPGRVGIVTAHLADDGWKVAPDIEFFTLPRLHMIAASPGAERAGRQ